MFKEIGNSVYGLSTKGISNKMKYDYKTKLSSRLRGNELSNPLISSWTTAFIRSVIGEVLHNTSLLKGNITSVTTDGFVSDVSNLEEKLLADKTLKTILLQEYRNARYWLSKDPSALELKTYGKGILTWTTRGQFSFDARIVATTGLQRSAFKWDELRDV